MSDNKRTFADDDHFTVTVYRNHPMWEHFDDSASGKRWFQMPVELLNELFVCRYQCHEDWGRQHIERVERENPDCVYIY